MLERILQSQREEQDTGEKDIMTSFIIYTPDQIPLD
jgi:hypothetical protein